MVHDVGGQLYYDGANLNAIMGICRPGDMGFDVLHINTHKTFSTPHGGGGPGSGPIGVTRQLSPYLPAPRVAHDGSGGYRWDEGQTESIGRVHGHFGNFGMLVRAYAYLLALGEDGLRNMSRRAVLNANYLKEKLKDHYDLAFDGVCKHECVFSPTQAMLDNDVHALNIAKSLIDRGFHPPTIYFPSIVREAIMIEPTETESKETLDRFIAAMIEIAELALSDPQQIRYAPVTTPVSRPNETIAARVLDIASIA